MGISTQYGTKICDLPHGELTYPAGGPRIGKGALQLAAADRTRIESLARAGIDAARGLFVSLGVTEAQGAGPIKVVVEPVDPMDPSGHFHNASWNPLGDEMLVGHVNWGASYAEATDVIVHEFSHRVIDRIAKLRPDGESGAVAESLADTFAAAVDTDDWTIAENVLPTGLRSMIDPGRPEDAVKDKRTGEMRPLPDHIDDIIPGGMSSDDVHHTVGVPNKAAATIGEALGRQEMARLYLTAIRSHLRGEAIVTPQRNGEISNLVTFAGLAQSTIDAASALYGAQSPQLGVVRSAWATVGLTDAKIAAGLVAQEKLAARWERLLNS